MAQAVSFGGISDGGTVFSIKTNGTGFTNIHYFKDGGTPHGGVILSGETLYGTASGDLGNGTVFAIKTDGTGFTNLHAFTPAPGPLFTNSDGAEPWSALVISENWLYGTTAGGGTGGRGTIFRLRTNGTEFTVLYNFKGIDDGGGPTGDLVLSGDTLFGTTYANTQLAGTLLQGTAFAVSTNGTGFRTLHVFSGGIDGGNPYAGLTFSGDTLYGTTEFGGTSWGPYSLHGNGTVFSYSLPPQLRVTVSGTNAILSWSTNLMGLSLETSTNLSLPSIWIPISGSGGAVEGQYQVTNLVSSSQQFYRLTPAGTQKRLK